MMMEEKEERAMDELSMEVRKSYLAGGSKSDKNKRQANNRIAAILSHIDNNNNNNSNNNNNNSNSCNALVGNETGFLDMFSEIPDSEANGGQLVAEVLKSHGVKFVFTLSGGHISPILVSAADVGIRVIDVRHEVNSVFAADAVARLSGVCGVACVTAGPGVTNTITAIKNAQMAQSPVLLIGGAAATLLKGRGSLQDIDQISVLKPIVKFCASVTSVADIQPVLKRALQEAMSGVPGPVFVEFPLDVLYPILELRGSMGFYDRKRARDITPKDYSKLVLPIEAVQAGLNAEKYLAKKQPDNPVFLRKSTPPPGNFLVHQYMKYFVGTLFGGQPFQNRDAKPLPLSIPLPSQSDIQKVVSLLSTAKNPVLVLGSQATLLASRVDELRTAVEKLGIPTFLGGMSRGLLGRNCKNHIRQNRGYALKKADVVILAGAVCDFRMDYGRTLNNKSKIISVNRSSYDLTLNSPIFWSPTVASLADPGTFILELSKKFSGGDKFVDWVKSLKDGETKKETANRAKSLEEAFGRGSKQGQKLINPLELCEQLESLLPDDSILVADGGDFVATASYILRPRGPLRWLDPGAFGTLGVGGGFALGAKLVRPTAEVWIVWGDGSAGYSIAEMDTMKRHNIPCIGLIGNDACWTQIEREQVPMFGSSIACDLEYCHYDQVAQGYIASGLSLSNTSDIKDVLTKAQEIAKTQPVVINAHIGKTNFREGSLSV